MHSKQPVDRELNIGERERGGKGREGGREGEKKEFFAFPSLRSFIQSFVGK